MYQYLNSREGIWFTIHLAHELTTEGVDDTGDGGSGTLADEVEVKHTLDSPGLHTTVADCQPEQLSTATGRHLLYEASRLVVEEGVAERRAHTAGGVEAGDVVVGGGAIGGVDEGSRGRHVG